VALRLRRRGIDRVRPLAGGYDAWRAAGFPMETPSPPPPTDGDPQPAN
jgi:3-mercaptopyruvate sulfurtransferase SseA